MKKKTITYSLLVLVLGIWGLIFFYIFSFISDEPQENQYAPSYSMRSIDTSAVQDTIQLVLQYPDPFFKTLPTKRVALPLKPAEKKSVSVPATPPPVKTRILWPQIEYDGLIMSKGTVVAMIKINSNSFIIPQGGEERDISVLTITQDSIIVTYKDEKKTVYKRTTRR